MEFASGFSLIYLRSVSSSPVRYLSHLSFHINGYKPIP